MLVHSHSNSGACQAISIALDVTEAVAASAFSSLARLAAAISTQTRAPATDSMVLTMATVGVEAAAGQATGQAAAQDAAEDAAVTEQILDLEVMTRSRE